MNAAIHHAPVASALPAPLPVPPAAPSLVDVFKSSCVLMRISAFAPSKTKTSDAATSAAQQVTGSRNGRYTGAVMLPEVSKGLNAATQRARRYLEKNSCAFGEYRLVLLTDYAEVRGQLDVLAAEYVEVVRTHTTPWHDYRQAVAAECAGLWAEDMVPATQQEYLDKCELRVSVMPMPVNPESIALPAALAQEIQSDIAREIHEQYSYVLQDQMEELVTALADAMQRVGEAKKISRNTFNSTSETITRLSRFNLTKNVLLQQVCDHVLTSLASLDYTRMNEDEQYRAKIQAYFETIHTVATR